MEDVREIVKRNEGWNVCVESIKQERVKMVEDSYRRKMEMYTGMEDNIRTDFLRYLFN